MTKFHLPISINVDWLSLPANLPVNLTDWLSDPLSLTARLKTHCQRFAVKVLFEQTLPATAISDNTLGEVSNQDYRIRQVLLLCDNKPWVFASTLIPQSTLEKGHSFLANLGDQPLGEVLFNHRDVTRGELKVAPFATNLLSGLPDVENGAETTLWGRSSTFYIEHAPLAVTEIFLPNCNAYVD